MYIYIEAEVLGMIAETGSRGWNRASGLVRVGVRGLGSEMREIGDWEVNRVQGFDMFLSVSPGILCVIKDFGSHTDECVGAVLLYGYSYLQRSIFKSIRTLGVGSGVCVYIYALSSFERLWSAALLCCGMSSESRFWGVYLMVCSVIGDVVVYTSVYRRI